MYDKGGPTGSVRWHIKQWAKNHVVPFLDGLGVFEADLERLRRDPSRWTVLMYHRVITDPREDPFSLGMCVQAIHFEAQMSLLRANFHPMAAGEAAASLARGETLPPGTVSVTFDDGYLDNLTNALPILQRYEIPATLFVATENITEGVPFWWDRAIAALGAWQAPLLDLEILEPRSAFGRGRLPMKGLQHRHSVERILDGLWRLSRDEVDSAIQTLEQHCGSKNLVRPLPMTPEQLVSIHQSGVAIGAHTVRHPNLALMAAEDARYEMRSSREYLQALLQTPIDGFAYPGGRATEDVKRCTQELGFAYAMGTRSGIWRDDETVFDIPRIGTDDSPVGDFKRSLSQYSLRPRRH